MDGIKTLVAITKAADNMATRARASAAMVMCYRQTSNTSFTKSQNLNVSHLVLQLSLGNVLKPGVKSRMKM